MSQQIASAEITARMVRNVRYWNTLKNDSAVANCCVSQYSMSMGLFGFLAGQVSHDALQAAGARTLHQHGDGGVEFGVDGAGQRVGIGKPARAGAKGLRRECAQRAGG